MMNGPGTQSGKGLPGAPLGAICCEYITLDNIVWKATWGASFLALPCRPPRKAGLLEPAF
jgi:hypothetical protein